MTNYNIPMKNLSVQFSKEKRVFEQLTNKNALIDALLSLYNTSTQCQNKQDTTHKFIQLYKPIHHEINKSKISLKDFKLLYKDFVEGAFGKVTIVKSIHDKKNIYAMKTLRKSYLNQQIDRSSPMEERLILSNPNEPWLPALYASFQDKHHLYLVMEYAHGGDLENLMERRSCHFLESEAKFYCIELILAVERVHELGYMHRDIKPANILIDSQGHIKLGDLGSCISIDTKDSLFMVGTMPYISPEMCNFEGTTYGPEVDWWSVGIVFYELIYGVTPFTGRDIQIQMNLLNPKVEVGFNKDVNISNEAKDLLKRLLAKSKDERLGLKGGAQEIKSHPFFKDVDWDNFRTNSTPPFIPSIKSLDDISFFASTNNQDDDEDEDEEDEEEDDDEDMDRDLPYIGYSYSCSELDSVTTKKPEEENQTFITPQSADTKFFELDNLKAQLIEKDKTIEQKNEQVENLQNLLTEKMTEITRIKQLELEIQTLKKENKTMKQEIINHQQTITEKIPVLEKENKRLSTQNSELCQKLRSESIHSSDLLKQIKAQTDLINQSQSECAELKQELTKLKQQNSDTKVKRTSKTLPMIPVTTTATPSSPRIPLEHSPAEGRSLILSSMWQRDRESLKNVQRDLEVSENNLASSKRQILRLKKELNFYQRNKLQQYPLPSTPPLDAIEFSPNYLGNEDELMDQIRREQNFIHSTKRTISSHARLFRNHGEVDQELNKTLEQATKNLSMLESKLRKNQPQKLYSPRDFFTSNDQNGK